MDPYVNAMAAGFENELQKIAQDKLAQGGALKSIGEGALSVAKSPKFLLPAAGILGWEALRRANEDRRLGRQLRVRSQR